MGAAVEAKFGGRGEFYPGKIEAVNADGTFAILFDDGNEEPIATREEVKLVVGEDPPGHFRTPLDSDADTPDVPADDDDDDDSEADDSEAATEPETEAGGILVPPGAEHDDGVSKYLTSVAVPGDAPPIDPRDDGLLRALLYPIDLDAFRREHWLKRPLALTGAGDARLALLRRALLGRDAAGPSVDERTLGQLLARTASERVHVWLPTRSCDDDGPAPLDSFQVEDAAAALACHSHARASLYCQAPPALSNALVRSAARALGVAHAAAHADGARRGEVELFATAAGHSTDWHTDFQENFTVQITGSKTWRLAPGGAPARPLRARTPHYRTTEDVAELQLKAHHAAGGGSGDDGDGGGRAGLARPAHLDHEHQSVTLRPGDVLYHPAGAWHRVECEGTGLSLNISLVLSSRADLVADALRQILWRDAAWRAPPCALAPPGAARGDAELAALVRDRLPAALEALTAAGTAGGLLPPCAACAPIRPRARRVFAGFGDSIDCEQIEEAEDGDDDDEDNDEDDDSGGNDGGGGGGEADDNDEQRAPTLDLLAAPHTRLRRNPLALLLRGDACRQRDGTGDKEPSGADDDDDDDDETPSRGERVRFIINVGFGNEELTSTSRCELFVPPHAASLVDTVGEYHEVGAGVFTASELLADAEPAPKKKAKHNSAATAPASTTKPRGRVPKGMAWSEDEKKWVLAEARGDESCAASRARVLEALVESGLLLIADR